MAADAMMEDEVEELRFCFNIDVTEDEFYQNIPPPPESGGPGGPVNIFFL